MTCVIKIYLLVLLGLLGTLAIQASPLPKEEEEESKHQFHAYTDSNETGSTIDEILQEITAAKEGKNQEQAHTINKRYTS